MMHANYAAAVAALGSLIEQELERLCSRPGRRALLVRVAFDPDNMVRLHPEAKDTSDEFPIADAPPLSRVQSPPVRQVCLTAVLCEKLQVLAPAAVAEEQAPGQFAILLDDDTTDARAIVEQLRLADSHFRVTTARFPEDGSSLASLWEHAGASTRLESLDGLLLEGVIAADPGMVEVFQLARRLAQTTTTVLILGETGVGKEVVAEQIHRGSPRRSRPFIRLNCASLPETLLESELFGYEKGAFTGADRRKLGYLEAADGGTLFLDEIGELPPSMQVKLLRVLETRRMLRLGATKETEIHVRIVCATHRDLEAEVLAGRFRRDLFYRISAFALVVPPLRDRPSEIPLLANLFARRFAKEMGSATPGLAREAVSALIRHHWPGNIRELRNAIERAVVMAEGDAIQASHLPPTIHRVTSATVPPVSGGAIRDQLAEIERRSIEATLAQHRGNRTHAARALGMSRRSLLYKLAKYGLKSS